MRSNFLIGLGALASFTACRTTTRSTESGYGPRIELKQSVGVSSNFDNELEKLGKKSSNFCFSIVDNNGLNFLYVQASPCKPQDSTGILVQINSVAPGEGLFLNGVEIGRFSKSQLKIESLCSGYYQSACSLVSGLGNKTASISMKKVSDQGMVQKLDDKAIFQYQVQDQGTQYEVFFAYRSLDDLVDIATCKDGSNTISPNFFDNYIDNADADRKVFPPSITVNKATGKSTGYSTPVLVIDSSGKLRTVDGSTLKFEILRSAGGSSKQGFSEVLCSNIGMAPAEGKYQVQDIPIYGNWCGPGHGGDVEEDPPAIDGVDRACMRHDLCYASRRYNDCNCDGRLLHELPGESASSSEGEAARVAILAYFAAAPCVCTKKVCVFHACRDVSVPSCCGSCPG